MDGMDFSRLCYDEVSTKINFTLSCVKICWLGKYRQYPNKSSKEENEPQVFLLQYAVDIEIFPIHTFVYLWKFYLRYVA